jgi:hypothetical protein
MQISENVEANFFINQHEILAKIQYVNIIKSVLIYEKHVLGIALGKKVLPTMLFYYKWMLLFCYLLLLFGGKASQQQPCLVACGYYFLVRLPALGNTLCGGEKNLKIFSLSKRVYQQSKAKLYSMGELCGGTK